jgi:hypothetical protein
LVSPRNDCRNGALIITVSFLILRVGCSSIGVDTNNLEKKERRNGGVVYRGLTISWSQVALRGQRIGTRGYLEGCMSRNADVEFN